MSFFQKNKPTPDDDLPILEEETLAGTVTQARRAATQARPAAEETLEAENEGLPSVNRRKRGNKLITALGFIFILCAGAAMLFAVNGEKSKDPKKTKGAQQQEQIANNLPPLAIPAPAQPVRLTATAAEAKPAAQPIPLQNSRGGFGGNGQAALAPQLGPDGKPLKEWADRKMLGTLLIENRTGGSSNASRPAFEDGPVRPVQPAIGAQAGSGELGGGRNDLATKLEPTITKGVSAALLPDRNYMITKGTALDCALETALDSSVPGMTTCRLTRDTYSDNGQVVLLDRGSQLVGEYQGGLKQGQVRLFVLWTRAKTPSGVIVNLNSPGTDALGRSGLEGWVDTHFMERFGTAILMSFVKDTVAAILARQQQNSGTTITYGNTAESGEKVVEKMLEAAGNIPPTMIKNQGDHIQVMVARDLDFSGVYALQVKQ